MPYQVQIEDSGHGFSVNEGEYILDAALRQGIALPYGCQSGGCGACRVQIASGNLVYEDGEAPPALSTAEQSAGYALLCSALARSDLKIRVEELPNAHAIRVRNLPARIHSLAPLCHDVMAVKLMLPGNQRLDYLAGQYVDILLRNGERRSFSIANAPGTDALLELHIRRISDGSFTTRVFENMRQGDLLRLEGPLGNFWLRDSTAPIVLMAGGTGFAPIKAIMEQLLLMRSSRPIQFYWGVRARRDLYANDLATQWASRQPNIRYIPVLSEPDSDDDWDGRTGWVHEAVLDDYPSLRDHEVYMSGPPPMIHAAREAFTGRGLDPGDLHYDSFDFYWEVSRQ